MAAELKAESTSVTRAATSQASHAQDLSCQSVSASCFVVGAEGTFYLGPKFLVQDRRKDVEVEELQCLNAAANYKVQVIALLQRGKLEFKVSPEMAVVTGDQIVYVEGPKVQLLDQDGRGSGTNDQGHEGELGGAILGGGGGERDLVADFKEQLKASDCRDVEVEVQPIQLDLCIDHYILGPASQAAVYQGALNWRSNFLGLTLVAVKRDNMLIVSPDAKFELCKGDVPLLAKRIPSLGKDIDAVLAQCDLDKFSCKVELAKVQHNHGRLLPTFGGSPIPVKPVPAKGSIVLAYAEPWMHVDLNARNEIDEQRSICRHYSIPPTQVQCRVVRLTELSCVNLSQAKVLYIMCHIDAEGHLYLEEDEDGGPVKVSPEDFATKFVGEKQPELVILNCCHSHIAGKILQEKGFGCVIAYDGDLPQKTARAFSGQFTTELMRGGTHAFAFEAACKVLSDGQAEHYHMFGQQASKNKKLSDYLRDEQVSCNLGVVCHEYKPFQPLGTDLVDFRSILKIRDANERYIYHRCLRDISRMLIREDRKLLCLYGGTSTPGIAEEVDRGLAEQRMEQLVAALVQHIALPGRSFSGGAVVVNLNDRKDDALRHLLRETKTALNRVLSWLKLPEYSPDKDESLESIIQLWETATSEFGELNGRKTKVLLVLRGIRPQEHQEVLQAMKHVCMRTDRVRILIVSQQKLENYESVSEEDMHKHYEKHVIRKSA
eukprot:TRINITY_DN7520_c0_g1_i1.p1 TRINITY_DN7520_c0_g1~~TRINITY_DN7520_c0_g1_i1.p1  ORF type:complete len:717 (-),score=96.43 TRINITY_DN7520_c0_g1_i1:73-2223(-)